MTFVLPPPPVPAVAVVGGGRFPVRRIFCIGRNFADHVRELGGRPKADPPVFFTKPADAVVASGSSVPYPPATQDLHFEGELVLALGRGGQGLASVQQAQELIFGYACGCDLTRRDLQRAAKAGGGPWDAAKAFDWSAPVGDVLPAAQLPAPALAEARLQVEVNGAARQAAALGEMIWSVPEVLVALSQLFCLAPGDLVFTGTPAGVGPLQPGDRVRVSVTAAGIPSLAFTVG